MDIRKDGWIVDPVCVTVRPLLLHLDLDRVKPQPIALEQPRPAPACQVLSHSWRRGGSQAPEEEFGDSQCLVLGRDVDRQAIEDLEDLVGTEALLSDLQVDVRRRENDVAELQLLLAALRIVQIQQPQIARAPRE